MGHEVDVSISDFVADLRAPTPSAAAEIVSTDNSELVNKVTQLYSRLMMAYANQHKRRKLDLIKLNKSLSLLHPSHQVQLAQQKTDELQLKLTGLINNKLAQSKHRHGINRELLLANTPKHKVEQATSKQQDLARRLQQSVLQQLQSKTNAFAKNVEKLNIVSPLATLERGYSITQTTAGEVVTKVAQAKQQQALNIKLSDGDIKVKVDHET